MAVEVYQPQSPAVQRSSGLPLSIKGRKKAAILLVSLGSEKAASILECLQDDEIETLSLEMAKLHFLDPDTTDGVLEELAATVEAYESLSAGRRGVRQGGARARDRPERARRSSAGSRP
jgi:flagellar motor switch protein FliG